MDPEMPFLRKSHISQRTEASVLEVNGVSTSHGRAFQLIKTQFSGFILLSFMNAYLPELPLSALFRLHLAVLYYVTSWANIFLECKKVYKERNGRLEFCSESESVKNLMGRPFQKRTNKVTLALHRRLVLVTFSCKQKKLAFPWEVHLCGAVCIQDCPLPFTKVFPFSFLKSY